jgi:hypothetical protein
MTVINQNKKILTANNLRKATMIKLKKVTLNVSQSITEMNRIVTSNDLKVTSNNLKNLTTINLKRKIVTSNNLKNMIVLAIDFRHFQFKSDCKRYLPSRSSKKTGRGTRKK